MGTTKTTAAMTASNDLLDLSMPYPKILVVDDRHENHIVIEKILAYSHAEIYNAHSGTDALSLTLRHKFAVVLLDVMMPVMDGFETASLIRINEDTKSTPIIFITAADRNEEFEFRGYELGAVDYLFKPIQPHSLVSKVKVFLDLEQQRHQLQRTLEDLLRLENRNQLLLDSIGEGIIGTDTDGYIIFTNPAAEKILGTPELKLKRKHVLDVIFFADPVNETVKWSSTPFFHNCSLGNSYHETVAVFWNATGKMVPVEYTATPILEQKGFIGIVIAFQDITERKRTEEQLIRLAQYDSLTGLINRYSFGKALKQALSRADRGNNQLSLLFIDLDQFKQVNDTLGHEIGDFLLQEVAIRLKACVRGGDVISRLGGDEFTIILESYDQQSAKISISVAEKVLSSLARPFVIRGNEICIGASIGISVYPISADNPESLMRSADLAMYRAKDNGGHDYQFFTDAMQAEAQAELELESQLREAVDKKCFSLYYQPKIDLSTGIMSGVEALLRWKNKDGVNISPDVFVPKLEEMGLIEDVGEWVINEACLQSKKIKVQMKQGRKFTIAINLSMRQLNNPDMVNMLVRYLEKHQVSGEDIEVEITESMMMSHPVKVIKRLNEIHKLGVTIAIDDFGTGYSSLSYLHNMPIDALKIDKSFIQNMDRSENSEKIVRAIVSLAQNLNLSIIAEGVETKEQLKFLDNILCDVIQGYYYCKPVPEEELVKLLDKYWEK